MSGITSIFGALKYVPATVARKALEKANPKFGNYFASALAYGFDAGSALDYLTSRFESDAQRARKDELERGAVNNTLRPDEMLSRSEMANAEIPGKILKGATALGAGALAAGSILPKAKEAGPESNREVAQPEPAQRQVGPREQALKRHSEMNKRKKIIDQLTEDFENEYGQGNVSAARFPGATQGSPSNERIQQETPGQSQNLERLIQLLQQRKQRGL